MKKLLMLGGGFLQNFVIKKAREMGYYVFCLDAGAQMHWAFCQQMNMHVIILWMKKHVIAYARGKSRWRAYSCD